MSEYWKKLKDPRWQKKRLEVMERDGWECVMCGNKEDTLNVHHVVYRKGAEPWEYESKALKTLCEKCHKNVETSIFTFRLASGKFHDTAVLESVTVTLLAVAKAFNETGFYDDEDPAVEILRAAAHFVKFTNDQIDGEVRKMPISELLEEAHLLVANRSYK